MVTHKTKLLQLTKEKDCKGIKLSLESLDYQVKGSIFEWYLAELYRGNGWLTNIQGGKQDLGADILLYHPKTPSKAAMVIQAKNHFKPLTFDQTKIELIKFEQKAARHYDCQQFQIVAVNGFVADASKLSEFNMILSDWNHIADLIANYDPDTKTDPEIELYAHNKITYENIKKLWKEGNYVAVVQATGTGKSILIAKLMSDFLGQKTLVFAPSHYILDQQKTKVPWATQSTTFMTYAKISNLTQQQIGNLDVELIVLDEFHRCGAEVWSAGVQRILTAYADSYVIGTTATPIRYLDDSRDMSDELFEGVVAANISLAEAIIKRILPAPTYVAVLYTLREEIEELREKLFKSNLSEEKKKIIEREINQVAVNWEKTLGVPQILAKHLRPDINKLIVFCKDQNHLDEMEVEVQKWFQKAATHRWRKVYRVISADPESNRNLEDFKKSHSKDTIHLLFAIDMLNEGLHLPDVGAVILLRPTESPIIFYQQIGRCIQVGANQAPIIFDFVNNFRSIRAGDFLQDLQEAKNLEKAKRADLGLEEYAPTIHVIDETKEIIEVFDEIEDRLASWESMYEKLLEFKKKNGHCNVPDRWPEDPQLGRWVGKQRTKRNRGLLSNKRIERLNKIGFIWDVLAANWEEMFEYLLEFKKQNGHCNIPSRWPENHRLSRWVFTQREFWKNGKLGEDRINRLEAVGFEWNILETNWNKMFSALLKFKEKNGHCKVPRTWPGNPDLSYWVSKQRENYRKKLLSPDRIEHLQQIGFIWDTIQNSWEENYSALIEFKSATGNCDVPDKWPMNLKLSHWVGKQRSDWKKKHLSADRIEKLNAIGFTWDPLDAVWNKMYWMLQEFNKNNGHCNVPRNWSENIKLSRWVTRIRKLWKDGKLSQERIKQLESLGFTIIDHDAIKNDTWEKMFSSLCDFKNIHGHCKVPHQWHQNPESANWVSNQRQMKRKNRLNSDSLRKLNQIGFIWHTRENLWEKRFAELLEFKKAYDHCNVPKDWSENPKLGTWVNNQRRNKKKNILNRDRICRLDEIGFLWDMIDTRWEDNYVDLYKYYKRYGNTDVPTKWHENPQLGKWVSYQRSQRRRNRLSESQILRLDNIKFNWNPRDKWDEMYSNLFEFKNLYGHCNVPRGWQANPELSNWVNRQRRQYKAGQMDKKHIKKIEDIGFLWDIRQNIWEERFLELFLFKANIGHCDVPDKWGENPKLSNWVGVQRRNYIKGKMNHERVTRLNEIGFVWEPIDTSWAERFSELIRFKELNGHCHVPQRFTENPKLGRWAARQRASIRRKQLGNERARLLEEIGFE